MLQVPKDELADVKTSEPTTVDKTRTVYPRMKANEDSPVTHVMDKGVTFDFDGIGVPQLYRLACRQLVIQLQATFRKASVAEQNEAAKWERTFSVKEMLDSQRTPVSDVVKADRALEKLTEDEKKALFERYMASQK